MLAAWGSVGGVRRRASRAIYPEHGEDAPTLTKNADIAIYLAKEEGKNDFRFFSAGVKTQSIERLMLETGLRQALEQGELKRLLV